MPRNAAVFCRWNAAGPGPRAAAAAAWAVLLFGGAVTIGQEPDGTVNRWCPVMTDREVDEASATLVHEGKSVRLCCKKCVAKFRADPGKYLPRLPQFGGHEDGESSTGPATGSPEQDGSSAGFRPGRFHPLVVHFPIAFLILAAALEVFALARRRPAYGPAVRPLLVAGAAGATLAAILGSLLSEETNLNGAAAELLDRHSMLGWTVAGVSLLAVLLGEILRRRGGNRIRALYAVALLASAGLVGATGHAGGLLVFGTAWFAGG